MGLFGLRAALCVPLVAGLVAGCSSSAKHGPVTTPPASGPVPQSVPNDVNARRDVTMSVCKAAAGGWAGGGTVKNTTSKSATYAITVFFTNTHATDLGYASTSVVVAAGKSKPWTAKATFAAPRKVLCVLRGVARN